jgi:hypothetical protein
MLAGEGARVVHGAVGTMDVEAGCLELGRAGQIWARFGSGGASWRRCEMVSEVLRGGAGGDALLVALRAQAA